MSDDPYGVDRSVFDGVLISLADTWESRAAELRDQHDNSNAAAGAAHGLVKAAGDLRGLVKMARGES